MAQEKQDQLQKKKNTTVDNLLGSLELSIVKVESYAKKVKLEQSDDNDALVAEDKRLNEEIKALYESSARAIGGLDKFKA